MLKINLQLCSFVMVIICSHDGATVNYSPYANNNHHHLLEATNSDDDGYDTQHPGTNENPVYQPNRQGNNNYQQMYRYYYAPPYQKQQQLIHQQPSQLWSGLPIVVGDDTQQQQQPPTNVSPTFYQQRSTGSGIRSSSEWLSFLNSDSKIIPPTVYNSQPPTRTTQFHYNNNNNNNIVYHRDFRHQIDVLPESQGAQHDIVPLSNQDKQHELLEQQQKQPQQFYGTNLNLPYNGISNELLSLRKDEVPDYTEHFKRYLENNPNRIPPIY